MDVAVKRHWVGWVALLSIQVIVIVRLRLQRFAVQQPY
jgi:hypothetical protein